MVSRRTEWVRPTSLFSKLMKFMYRSALYWPAGTVMVSHASAFVVCSHCNPAPSSEVRYFERRGTCQPGSSLVGHRGIGDSYTCTWLQWGSTNTIPQGPCISLGNAAPTLGWSKYLHSQDLVPGEDPCSSLSLSV